MKKEKYVKALKAHQEKLFDYAMTLHRLVDMMLDDDVSMNDVLGVLEAEKMWRFNNTIDNAKVKTLGEMLDDLAGIFDDEEE